MTLLRRFSNAKALVCGAVLLAAVTNVVYWQCLSPHRLQQMTIFKDSSGNFRNETMVLKRDTGNGPTVVLSSAVTDQQSNRSDPSSVDTDRHGQVTGELDAAGKIPTTNETAKMKDATSDHSPQNPTASFPPPRVVILPGPHKAGSTSLQTCMVDWALDLPNRLENHRQKVERWNRIQERRKKRGKSFEEHMPSELQETPDEKDLVLPGWSWPTPLPSVLKEIGMRFAIPNKAFSSLLVIADHDFNFSNRSSIPSSMEKDQIMASFQAPMVDAWQNGNNIVYGSEEFDRIPYPKHLSSTEVMETILDVLPWEKNIARIASSRLNVTASVPSKRTSLSLDDLEAVVVYRSPKVSLLKSLWNEVGKHGSQQSFRDFLSCVAPGEPCFRNYPFVFDPLVLANVFVERGIRTTVVDMAGIQAIANKGKSSLRERTNLCHILACDILGEECTANTKLSRLVERTGNTTSDKILRSIDVSTQQQNKGEDTRPINLTDSQWDQIESALQNYDCGWAKPLTSSPLFRILYQHNIFASCEGKSKQQQTMPQLLERVENIARGNSTY